MRTNSQAGCQMWMATECVELRWFSGHLKSLEWYDSGEKVSQDSVSIQFVYPSVPSRPALPRLGLAGCAGPVAKLTTSGAPCEAIRLG